MSDYFSEAGIDFLHIVIPRTDIEIKNFSPCIEVLSKLLFSPDTIRRFHRRVVFSVSGYDRDPRELYEVLEVRTYIAELDRRFPYWFYFLSLKGGNLELISFCVCGITKSGPGLVHYDPGELSKFLLHHYGAMNAVCDQLGLSDEENVKLTSEIEQLFFNGKKSAG